MEGLANAGRLLSGVGYDAHTGLGEQLTLMVSEKTQERSLRLRREVI